VLNLIRVVKPKTIRKWTAVPKRAGTKAISEHCIVQPEEFRALSCAWSESSQDVRLFVPNFEFLQDLKCIVPK
jgi:hypothetical protein